MNYKNNNFMYNITFKNGSKKNPVDLALVFLQKYE
jgi:hypothetical protein